MRFMECLSLSALPTNYLVHPTIHLSNDKIAWQPTNTSTALNGGSQKRSQKNIRRRVQNGEQKKKTVDDGGLEQLTNLKCWCVATEHFFNIWKDLAVIKYARRGNYSVFKSIGVCSPLALALQQPAATRWTTLKRGASALDSIEAALSTHIAPTPAAVSTKLKLTFSSWGQQGGDRR